MIPLDSHEHCGSCKPSPKITQTPHSGSKQLHSTAFLDRRSPALLTSGPVVQSIADGRYKRACKMAVADVSHLLRAWSDGDQLALDELTPIVYAELRRLAHRYM